MALFVTHRGLEEMTARSQPDCELPRMMRHGIPPPCNMRQHETEEQRWPSNQL